MNRFLKLTLCIHLFIVPLSTFGKQTLINFSDDRISEPDRRRVPSRNPICLVYDSETKSLTYNAPYISEEIYVEINGSSISFSNILSHVSPEWVIPLTEGEYQIVCITKDNRILTGCLKIEND